MDNLILSRVLLFIFTWANLLFAYAVVRSVFCNPIKAKNLVLMFALEMILLTGYIVYDNMQSPPQDGWILAIIGYFFVYLFAILPWPMLIENTIVPPKVKFEMTMGENLWRIWNKHYAAGYINLHGKKVNVLLPWEEFEQVPYNAKIMVKVKEILSNHTIVTLCDNQ